MPSLESLPKTTFSQYGFPAAGGPWSYQILPEPALSYELTRLAGLETIGNVSCVSLQPSQIPEHRSQDRYVVHQWNLSGGTWKFAAVFDGHGGEETAEHIVEALPLIIQGSLCTAISTTGGQLSPAIVSDILAQSITLADEGITNDLLGLFPGGPDAIAKLSDDEIRAVINDQATGGKNNAKVLRCMRGSTALVSLVDPQGQNLWVASLGDCQAVLGIKSTSGKWSTSILSANHNGADASEVARIHSEHADEAECVLRNRVLGAIAVTRAIGDHLFKLPSIYTERVFKNCSPGFRLSTPLNDFIGRNKTPPYLSNMADVRHVDISSSITADRFLIMCSDGLVDLYMCDNTRTGTLQTFAEGWVNLIGGAGSQNSFSDGALRLLRDALGGDDEDRVAQMLTVEMGMKWMDDTTVLVQPL
ncbi:protein serine threonine phosphatase 2C [Leucogyrophana mollusca]|uniref:Protein serine threonine phosphatase 2C n=1 Tax=Leucogyrophana mollusca TaxID=85980 RepID=A0ACB8B9H0_9AGAM|nr:protein serine threonine phosphatase 2C [Leucogyrophana mollusca]